MKKNRGITLIALVITIVILLILSSVAIATITGNNGLFSRAKQAKENSKYSSIEEQVKLAVNASYDNTASLNKEMLKENLNKIEGINPKIENVEFDLSVTIDGYQFLITELGQVNNGKNNENNEYEKEEQSLALLEHFDDDKGIIIDSDKITTEDKKVGNSSLKLDNTACVDANTKKFEFDKDFTIEYWLKLAEENLNIEWGPQVVVGNYGGIWIGLNSGKFVVRGWGVTNYLTLEPPLISEWVHIAITRKDGIISVFYNGILQGTVQNSIKFTNWNLYIGADSSNNYTKGNSYIDELKILNGVAKYTNDFDITKEPEEFSNEIIYHFENNIGLTEKNSTISFDNKKIGIASSYFNNTYMKYKTSDGKYKLDKDFTIDYWINQSNENLNEQWSIQLAVKENGGILLCLNNGKFVVRGWGLTNYLTLEPPPMDEWVHIAVTRKDGIIYVFYNGVLQESAESSIVFADGDLYLGYEGTGYYSKDTYMDELRILNGYCAWTNNFQVPSSPYNY
ncbi:large adhesin [Clostridium sp. CAG:575]|nr:large adhesin [Clostridium sp. CAG:575]